MVKIIKIKIAGIPDTEADERLLLNVMTKSEWERVQHRIPSSQRSSYLAEFRHNVEHDEDAFRRCLRRSDPIAVQAQGRTVYAPEHKLTFYNELENCNIKIGIE